MSRLPLSQTLEYLNPPISTPELTRIQEALVTNTPVPMPDPQELVREARLLRIIETTFGLYLSPLDLAYCRHLGMPYTRLGIRSFFYRPETCLAWLSARHITPNTSADSQEVA